MPRGHRHHNSPEGPRPQSWRHKITLDNKTAIPRFRRVFHFGFLVIEARGYSFSCSPLPSIDKETAWIGLGCCPGYQSVPLITPTTRASYAEIAFSSRSHWAGMPDSAFIFKSAQLMLSRGFDREQHLFDMKTPGSQGATSQGIDAPASSTVPDGHYRVCRKFGPFQATRLQMQSDVFR